MTSQDASTKVDGEKRHARGEEIPDSSVKVNHNLYIHVDIYSYMAHNKSDIIHAIATVAIYVLRLSRSITSLSGYLAC